MRTAIVNFERQVIEWLLLQWELGKQEGVGTATLADLEPH
jgi:hypothetical protein